MVELLKEHFVDDSSTALFGDVAIAASVGDCFLELFEEPAVVEDQKNLVEPRKDHFVDDSSTALFGVGAAAVSVGN